MIQPRRSPRSRSSGFPLAPRMINPFDAHSRSTTNSSLTSAPSSFALPPQPPHQRPAAQVLRIQNDRSPERDERLVPPHPPHDHHARSTTNTTAAAHAMDRGLHPLFSFGHEDAPPFNVPADLIPLYPEALTSPLAAKYTQPVVGTAVIDRMPEEGPLNDVVEMVSPMPSLTSEPVRQLSRNCFHSLRTPLLSPNMHTAGRQHMYAEMDAFHHNSSGDTCTSPHTVRLPSTPEFSNSSFGSPARVTMAPEAMNTHAPPRHVLRTGGYIIFSDEFIAQNPTNDFSTVSQDFKLLTGNSSASTSPVQPLLPSPQMSTATGADDSDDMARRTQLHSYITEVEAQQRPLFRRVSSARKYGRSSYISSSASYSSFDYGF